MNILYDDFVLLQPNFKSFINLKELSLTLPHHLYDDFYFQDFDIPSIQKVVILLHLSQLEQLSFFSFPKLKTRKYIVIINNSISSHEIDLSPILKYTENVEVYVNFLNAKTLKYKYLPLLNYCFESRRETLVRYVDVFLNMSNKTDLVVETLKKCYTNRLTISSFTEAFNKITTQHENHLKPTFNLSSYNSIKELFIVNATIDSITLPMSLERLSVKHVFGDILCSHCHLHTLQIDSYKGKFLLINFSNLEQITWTDFLISSFMFFDKPQILPNGVSVDLTQIKLINVKSQYILPFTFYVDTKPVCAFTAKEVYYSALDRSVSVDSFTGTLNFSSVQCNVVDISNATMNICTTIPHKTENPSTLILSDVDSCTIYGGFYNKILLNNVNQLTLNSTFVNTLHVNSVNTFIHNKQTKVTTFISNTSNSKSK
ncbi:hypothetical protein EIN_112030 [Entamoeba invadens IP1]|uniref:Uncharacterized protein n=1 Tax=Entamoeba invadens IP1 TaxID=370355 RepID=A0A0A1U3R6_ENTIV|nr:hypothetical protein EIN_112030 [Entamoeba invadens IP1]ELP86239.1 hypothetical protein EIN_112030 [Entamoeba invadens IP1]|eukprot:XP_004185585.1 hypothetical protein EIN_112030 [Entamoeba invadens IP1]